MKGFILLISFFVVLYAKVDYESYCKEDTKRETHIIIDLNGIDTILYGKVIKSLSYIPHEKVSLYYYDTTSNNIIKNYTFCNPSLTKHEIKKIKNGSLLSRAFGTDIDKMNDDHMFLQSKLIKRLANMQAKITNKTKSNFINSFSTITTDIKEQSRIILFTNEKFNTKSRAVNLKFANVSIFQKKLPSRKIISNNKDFFAKNKAYLKAIYTRPVRKVKTSNLNTSKANFNLIINNKKMKSDVFILADKNGNIINGWLSIYGVLLAPLEGTVKVSGSKIVSLNAKVPTKFKFKKNTAFKGDHIEIKANGNSYSGKYYNYAYAFKQDNFQYFEYKVK